MYLFAIWMMIFFFLGIYAPIYFKFFKTEKKPDQTLKEVEVHKE